MKGAARVSIPRRRRHLRFPQSHARKGELVGLIAPPPSASPPFDRCRRRRSPPMSDLPLTTHMMEFTVSTTALECRTCRNPPKPHCDGSHLYLCGAGGVVCRSCMPFHKASCGASHSSDCCRMLENIASRIKVKCACTGYFPYCKLKKHQNGCFTSNICTSAWRKCTLKTELLCCSICSATLRPPVFKRRYRDLLVCSDCLRADNADYFVSCPDLDYLFKCMMVKTRLPYFSPCDGDETNSVVVGSNIIIGKTNGKAPSKVGKTDKHIVERRELETGKSMAEASLNTSTCNKKANIATTSGNKTGISRGRAPPKVRKMNNHIVDSDVVESDDDSSDDIHPESGKRVAETVLKTSAYNKKAKIATPSGGQKTGEKMGAPVVMLHPAKN